MKVTNNTRETLDFVVPGTNNKGVADTVSIAPNETKSLSLESDHAVLNTYALMGAVTIEGASQKKIEAAVAAGAPEVSEEIATEPKPRRGGRRRKA
jgi:hypothetical protein